jgi:uncharacterized membrane protein
MITLIAFLGIMLGNLFFLAGILLIAAQVRVHRIRVRSRGHAAFRIGAVLLVIGLLLWLIDEGDTAFATMEMLVGWVGVLVAGLVWHHEQLQALEEERDWHWQGSLMAWLFLYSAAVILSAGSNLL